MNDLLRRHYGLSDNRPIIALAPMAGVTDLPFRTLCEGLGADYSVTEMAASAPQLLDSAKNRTRLAFPDGVRVKILQIVGNDAAQMAAAAVLYVEQGAEIIDINLGCPAKKVNSKGAGSALLSDLSAVKAILQAVTSRLDRHFGGRVPVTVKTRLGPEPGHYTLFEVASIAESLGVALLTVHGRTRACRFRGSAQFDEIARVKRAFPALALLANGDIDSVDKARLVLQITGCDGVMIGRAAVGNPWLFAELRAAFEQRTRIHCAHAHTMAVTHEHDVTSLILLHVQGIHRFYGGRKGVRFARKHIQAYLTHLGCPQAFARLAKIDDAHEQLAVLIAVLKAVLDAQPLK